VHLAGGGRRRSAVRDLPSLELVLDDRVERDQPQELDRRPSELVEAGDLHEIRNRGHSKTVGKEYQVRDGDVIEFLFSG
jgi:ribosome-binding ATPase YchF (GTP1/OBG family)